MSKANSLHVLAAPDCVPQSHVLGSVAVTASIRVRIILHRKIEPGRRNSYPEKCTWFPAASGFLLLCFPLQCDSFLYTSFQNMTILNCRHC